MLVIITSQHQPQVLPHALLKTRPPLPPKPPQQLPPQLRINGTDIVPQPFHIIRQLPAGIQLPQTRKHIVPVKGESIRQDAAAVDVRVHERRDMQPRRVLDVHHPLGEEGGEVGRQLARSPDGRDGGGRGGTQLLVAEDGAEVEVGADGVEDKGWWWRLLLLGGVFPQGLLGLHFAGGVDSEAAVGGVWRRGPGGRDGFFVPLRGVNVVLDVGLRAGEGDGGGGVDEALHRGLLGGGGSDVEGAGDDAWDDLVGIRGEGDV